MNPLPFPSWLSTVWPFGRRSDGRGRRLTSRVACRGTRCSLGRLIDISATGARVSCRRFYRPVEGKPARFSVTASDGVPLHIASTICWTRLGDGGWEAGLAFHGMNDTDARRLGEFIVTERRDDDIAVSA